MPFSSLVSGHCCAYKYYPLVFFLHPVPSEGFSHFFTSITAPVSSGWNDSSWVGLVQTKKSCLREQHIIDRIDLVTCEVMVVQKPTEIVDMVRSLQLATRNAEKLTGEVTGMPMTGSTTVVP